MQQMIHNPSKADHFVHRKADFPPRSFTTAIITPSDDMSNDLLHLFIIMNSFFFFFFCLLAGCKHNTHIKKPAGSALIIYNKQVMN